MAETLTFWKMNGAGNDFVMLDNRSLSLKLSKDQIAKICDRHRGIGADGMLAVEPPSNGADWKMRYYNADGGEAEMCGNGARCFARYVNKLHGNKLSDVKFETLAGVIGAEFHGDQVRINMSEPHSLKLNQSLNVDDTTLQVHSVNTGVPHAVVFVDDLDKANVQRLGAGLRYHEASPISVLVKGGDTLRIGFQKSGNTYQNVTLHGPADFVFEGTV